MTTSHLTDRQLAEYRSGALAPLDLLAADDHIVSCPDCRGRLASGAAVEAMVYALRTDLASTDQEHLTYEDLAAVVDGSAEPVVREMVGAHVEICGACAAELETLTDFAAGIRHLAPVRTQPAEGFVASARMERQERPRRSRWRPLLAAAATVAAVAIGAYLFFRDAERAPDLAQVEPPGPPIETPVAGDDERDQSPPPGTTVLTLADGAGLVTLDDQGNVRGLVLDDAEQALVSRALQSGRPVVEERIAALQSTRGTLLGDDAPGPTFELSAPLATAVRGERPTFRWRKVEGATRYRVEVFDTDFNAVASSQPLTETTWAPEEPLERDREYSWHVVASVDGNEVRSPIPPAPEAKFFVLDAATAAAIERDSERHADSHLVRALLFARAGLLDEAESELRRLEAANGDSPIVARLRQNLRAVARTP